MNQILKTYQKTNLFGADHNLKLNIVRPGYITYELTVQKKHLATPKVIHGGMIAALMDSILGVAALSLTSEEGKVVSTIEFKINYLKPVQLGNSLKGIGTVEQQGNRILVCSGEIIDSNSKKIVAKGLGTFNTYPAEKAGI